MNYEQLAETGFATLDRKGLRDACKEHGLHVGPNESEQSMRTKLCAAHGKATEPAGEDKAAAKSGGIPNLSTEGAWGGKMYDVIIRCQDPSITSCPLGTNGRYWPYKLNEVVRMPAPHYNNLKDRVGGRIVQVPNYQPGTGKVIGYTKSIARQQDFTIESAVVVPETANLPESYIEYFQRLARKRDGFAKFPREKLLFIHSVLKEHIGPDALRDMSDSELLLSIRRALGPEFDNSNDVDFDLEADAA